MTSPVPPRLRLAGDRPQRVTLPSPLTTTGMPVGNVTTLRSKRRRELPTVTASVLLEVVGEGQWRVVDAQARRDDAGSVLGFVEQIAGLFEVTFVSTRAPRSYCATLEAVQAEFLTNNPH